MAQQSAMPALPKGFVLDSPVPGAQASPDGLPPLPEGFQLDGPAAAPAPPAEDGDRWEITKGLLGGTFGTNPMMFGNATEVFGHLAGSEAMVGFGKNVQGYGEEQLSQYQGNVGSVADIRTDSIGNFIDDTADYASYGFGQGVSSMAPSMVAGGAVGLLTANPFIGIAAGAAGPSYIQNVGDVYGGLKEEMATQLKSGEISYEDVSKAAAIAGVPMAALDLVGVGKVLGTFKGGRDAVKRALISRVARGLATGFTVEGVTEGLQEVISQFTQADMSGTDFATKKRFVAIVDNAIIGGLAGGGFGAAGGAVAGDGRRTPKPTPKPEDVSHETAPVTDEDIPPPPPGFDIDPDTGIATPAAAAPVAAEEVAEAIAPETPTVAPAPSEAVTEPVPVAPPVEVAPEPVTTAPQEIEQAVAEVEPAPVIEPVEIAPPPAPATQEPNRLVISTGARLRSQSGREMSPVPKVDATTGRKSANSIRRIDGWLLDEAKREVITRPSVEADFQGTLLKAVDLKNISPSDRDMLNEIVFGDPMGATEENLISEITEVSSAGPAAVPATSDTAAPASGVQPADAGVADFIEPAADIAASAPVAPKPRKQTSESDMAAALAGSKLFDRYVEVKKANPDAIVFYRAGDFLEAMFEDAKVVSDVLGITLTKREKADRTGSIPMSGVPVHSAPQYIKELEDAGHKVVEFDPKTAPKQDILGPEDKAAVGEQPFYSKALRAVQDSKTSKAPGQQWLATLRNAGVKEEEIAWLGLDTFLQSGVAVTKADLEAFVQANQVELREVEKGEGAPDPLNAEEHVELSRLRDREQGRDNSLTPAEETRLEDLDGRERGYIPEADQVKFGTYTLPGGENYRELLLTLPPPSWMYPGRKDAPSQTALDKVFTGGHYDEPNVLAHIRFNERTDADGGKVLFIEEIQSDWHQKGRKQGYKGDHDAQLAEVRKRIFDANTRLGDRNVEPANNTTLVNIETGDLVNPSDDLEIAAAWQAYSAALIEERGLMSGDRLIPDAPFKKTWHELALRRMVRYAAENGFDIVAWTTGAQQADRYDLSKRIKDLTLYGTGDNLRLTATDHGDHKVIDMEPTTREGLADIIGKEPADKLLSQPEPKASNPYATRNLFGEDLKVGGEGMAAFYDRMLPNYANKLGKKFGAKVGRARLETGTFIVRDESGILERSSLTREAAETLAQQYRQTSGTEVTVEVDPGSGEGITVHSLPITPALRDTAMREGFQLFAAGAPAFTPKFVEENDRVTYEIKKILRAIAPHAKLRTVDTLWKDAGKTTQVRGAYNWMMDLVTVSLGYGDPVNTIRHEAVHSLKAMGMFTESEWSTLEREAERTWRAQHSTDTRYPDLAGNEAALNEEGVADAFADWRAGKQFAPGFRRIFQRIENFLKRLGNALRGLGFRTVDDIFERVERGEVGRRIGGGPKRDGVVVRYALSPDQDAALESIRGKIGADEPTLWQRLKEVIVNRPLERIKQAMFDDLHGLKLLEMSANAGKLYEDARSAYKLARLSRGIGDVIFDSMYYGAPIWKEGTTSIDTSVKAPMEIIDDLGDRLGDFEIYIAMRRAQELRQPSEQHPEGRENLFTDAEIAAGLALGKANTDFAGRFDDLQAYNKRILDFAQQSGLLGEETRSFFDEMHKNYVPFFRIMEGGDTKSPKARLGFSGQHPNFQKLRGGTANIDHPLLNIEANIHRLIEASVKNVVMLRTQQLNAELGNIFMKPVARGVEQAAVTNAQMIRDLEKQGLEITAEDGIDTDAIRTLWSLGNKPRGDNIVSLVRAGKVEFYEVTDPMLFRSLTMIHRTQIPFIQPFRMAKHLLTAAVGLDPSFQIANFLRDTMHASVISHIGFKPVIGSLRGFKSRMTKDADWRTFLQSGAGMSSMFEADRPTMHRVVETRIRKGHRPLGKILDSPRGFIGALEHMESTFEYSTRVGAFKKLRGEGAGLMEAAYQAREISTDFALKGDWIVMRLLAETVPFLNAGVQGLYRTARGGAENPVAFTIKGGIVAAASIALYLINRDDERFKELPPYQRDTYWHFWVGDQHYKIPKPFEVGAIFGSIPERMVEAAIDEERSDEFLERMQWIFSEMFRLSVVPQLAQPPMRVYSNWDDFRERPVVPPWLENVQPEEQFDTSTPLTAIEAGRLTGQSPKKIETLVSGYLGAWGGYLFSMADSAIRVVGDYPDAPATYLPERPVFRRLMGRKVPRSTYYTDQFYEMKREVDKTYASIQMLLGNGEVDRARTMLREHKGKLAVRDSLIKINTQLTKINRTIRALRISRTLTAKEKRERIDELYIVKNKLAKVAFKLKPLFDKRTQ